MAGPWEKYAQQPAPQTVGSPRPEKPPAGYQSSPGGFAPIPGGPADKPETSNLPTGWERPAPRAPAQRIPGLPSHITDPKTEGDAKLTEGERTGAGFYRRAYNAHRLYGEGVMPRNPLVQGVIDVLPNDWENALDEPERRAARNYAEEFIRAKLRKESGATITPHEMESEFRVYFPVPGDTRADLERKAALREQAIEGLKIAAGSTADRAVEGLDQPLPANDAEAQLEARIARGDDPRATVDWLFSIGRPPTPDQIDRIYQNYRNPRPDVRPPDGEPDPRLRQLGVGVGGVLQGVGDVANLVSSPFISAVNAATGSNYNPDMGANLRGLVGTPEPQGSGENLAYQVNRFGTGALSLAVPGGAAAPYIPGAVGNALARFGSAPLADAAAGSSAGAASEAARQAGGGPVAQVAAGLIGGAASLPVSSRVNALLDPNPAVPPVVRAGREEGVTVNRAMVDPSRQQRVTAVGKTMVGGKMMQRDTARVGDQIEGRVRNLGRGGTPLEPSIAGGMVERVAERAIETSGKESKRLYDRAVKIAGDTKVPPRNSVAIIDEMLGKLSETGGLNKAEIDFLQTLKSDFGKDLSVAALRDARTTLRKKISKGDLVFGQNEKRVLDIMDAAADDIANGLVAAGKRGAAQIFKRADQQYAQRMDFIKNTIQKVIGKRDAHFPPEKIIANLRSMMSPKGDSAGLARIVKEMEPDEQADLAATIAEGLGKNTNGEFSTAFLVRHIEKLPRSARVAVFGPQGARSLDNLAMLAREHKRVSGALGGSPTGAANDWRSWLTTLVFSGGGGFALDGGGTAIATAAGAAALKGGRDALSARALMSPKITGWLRSAPRTSDPKAINMHFDRLKAIAAREPALAPEIERLQEIVMRAANENSVTSRAAASEAEDRN